MSASQSLSMRPVTTEPLTTGFLRPVQVLRFGCSTKLPLRRAAPDVGRGLRLAKRTT